MEPISFYLNDRILFNMNYKIREVVYMNIISKIDKEFTPMTNKLWHQCTVNIKDQLQFNNQDFPL